MHISMVIALHVSGFLCVVFIVIFLINVFILFAIFDFHDLFPTVTFVSMINRVICHAVFICGANSWFSPIRKALLCQFRYLSYHAFSAELIGVNILKAEQKQLNSLQSLKNQVSMVLLRQDGRQERCERNSTKCRLQNRWIHIRQHL